MPPLECLASWPRITGWRDTQDLRINWTDQQSGAYTHQGAPPAGQGQVPGTPGLLKIPNISPQKSDYKNIIFRRENVEMVSFSFEISENCLSFGNASSKHSLTFDRYSVLMINTVLWFYQNFHAV